MRRSIKWEGALFMALGAIMAVVGLWSGSLLIALLGLIPLGGGCLLLFDHPAPTYQAKEKISFPREAQQADSDGGNPPAAPGAYWDGTYAHIYEHVPVRPLTVTAVPHGAALTLEPGPDAASVLYRGEPVAELTDSALLTMINARGGSVDAAAAEGARELAAISLRFAHPPSASVKMIRLTDTVAPEIQRTLSRCRAGLPVTLRIDFEKQRYRVFCEEPIGYLPKSAEALVEGRGSVEAVIHALSPTSAEYLAVDIAIRLH